MTKTEHYQLNQWDASDYVRREDFNEDNRKIEAALGKKASVVWGTYTGAGTYGNSNPNTLTFDFMPRLVIILGYATDYGDHILFLRPCAYGTNTNGVYPTCTVQWLDNGIQWYNSSNENSQFNRKNQLYYYIALA